jgi:hypothetical protein
VHEFKTSGPVYRTTVQNTLRASYAKHSRKGLIALPGGDGDGRTVSADLAAALVYLSTELSGVFVQLEDRHGEGRLWPRLMIERDDSERDLAALVVPRVGAFVETGDVWEPYRLVDPAGQVVAPVAVYLSDLQAIGRPATTQRSYGMDLLRRFRLLWAINGRPVGNLETTARSWPDAA